jgi:hypothetical protein
MPVPGKIHRALRVSAAGQVPMLIPFTAVRSASYALTLASSLVAGSGGCGPRREPESGVAPDPGAPTALSITNNNWLDAIVFVYHDGEQSRVGIVTAATSAHFSLASWLLGPTRSIRLVAHPIGSSRSIGTEVIHVQPGQLIEWRLENDLALSSVAVY